MIQPSSARAGRAHSVLLSGLLCTALACNTTELTDTTGGPDMSLATGCATTCAPPLVCSKAGAGCIAPGTCGGDADCPMGQICVAGDGGARTCVVGGRCGSTKVDATAVPPNLLIVLDRSCSMTDKIGTMTKWQIAVSELTTLATTYKGRIRFGLTLFPDRVDPACDQASIPIPVGPGNETAISTLLMNALGTANMYYPNNPCVTNIDTAMKQASGEPAFTDATRGSFALLLTDGEQSGCSLAGGANGATQIISDMYQKAKVPTFVVGFGSSANPTQLNAFAKAGGVPTGNATTEFYQAQDQAGLSRALTTIASKTVGCLFQLQSVPPNPMELYVYFDKKTRVPLDPQHMNGWDYDPAKNQVTFYGPVCDSLRAGNVMTVDIVYGCDAPPPG